MGWRITANRTGRAIGSRLVRPVIGATVSVLLSLPSRVARGKARYLMSKGWTPEHGNLNELLGES